MSYLLIRGRVDNVIDVAPSVDRKTGEKRPGYTQVQLHVAEPLQSGQERLGYATLSVDDKAAYEALRGSYVDVEVGAYVRQGAVAFFARKGCAPRLAVGADADAGGAAPAAARRSALT